MCVCVCVRLRPAVLLELSDILSNITLSSHDPFLLSTAVMELERWIKHFELNDCAIHSSWNRTHLSTLRSSENLSTLTFPFPFPFPLSHNFFSVNVKWNSRWQTWPCTSSLFWWWLFCPETQKSQHTRTSSVESSHRLLRGSKGWQEKNTKQVSFWPFKHVWWPVRDDWLNWDKTWDQRAFLTKNETMNFHGRFVVVSRCIFVCTYLGCPVPQTVHGYSCSIVRVSHIDDRLPDGLDHLLLTLQQTHQSEISAGFRLEQITKVSRFLTVLCLSGANVKKSKKTLWTRECLITCSLQDNNIESFCTIIERKKKNLKSNKSKCG